MKNDGRTGRRTDRLTEEIQILDGMENWSHVVVVKMSMVAKKFIVFCYLFPFNFIYFIRTTTIATTSAAATTSNNTSNIRICMKLQNTRCLV